MVLALAGATWLLVGGIVSVVLGRGVALADAGRRVFLSTSTG